MKRLNHLFESFCSFENLLNAYYKAKKGTRSNIETAKFFFHLEDEILEIQAELKNLQYKPAPYKYFKISDPKERTISVAVFRDRVVHHALVNILEPIYEARFIFDSYATRKGKGTHAAINRAQSFLQKNKWFFKTDIDKYFDSIDQNILMNILKKKIKDDRLLSITERIVKNGGCGEKGLPIGNLTSQFFANVYLNSFDTFVKEQLKARYYIRYMDDFVVFCKEKKQLKMLRQPMTEYLKDCLGLELKDSATFLNSSINGLTFLGKRVFAQNIRIAKPNLKRFLKRMKQKELAYSKGEITEETFLASMNSYWANLSFYNSHQLKLKLLANRY